MLFRSLVHSDICGLMNVRARLGAIYFITFINDFTRFGYVYLISHKSEVLDCFIKYSKLVENQLNIKIKALRTDRGREYLSEQFNNFCDKKKYSSTTIYSLHSTTKWSSRKKE